MNRGAPQFHTDNPFFLLPIDLISVSETFKIFDLVKKDDSDATGVNTMRKYY